ncbi:MAG: hypothetical protein AAFO03_21180, partial [Bacteroidota bacterium]
FLHASTSLRLRCSFHLSLFGYWYGHQRNILFKSPKHGGNNLYKADFDKDFQQTGLYIFGNKVRLIQVEIRADQIDELLQND